MADCVSITRVGTQVVVRLGSTLDDSHAERLREALDEINAIVLHTVVVDCLEADTVSGAGLEFLREVRTRWRLRVLNPPAGLRQELAEPR